ncbi:MAG: hypothetical protein HON29_01675 [Candidatus Magasanikbacteria bacterium]|jgi:hypothetical protein|nr:hypothetical protein [Candidatus Magasanikbacteria bacterium]MBT5820667.1 hypothetical protein [Candidatus Magasanikbacteria bacterium]
MNKNTHTIIKTLAFFDIFSHPLTAEELYKCMWKGGPNIKYQDWCKDLDTLVAHSKKVKKKDGCYMLAQNTKGVDKRHDRVWWVKRKMAVAKKAAKVLRFVPFLRAVFVCNMLDKTANDDSDIDVCVVVKNNRLWIVRLFATALLHVLRFRAHGKHTKDRICLSFYCTEDGANFSSMRISSPDIYLAYWIIFLIPIYDPDNHYAKILQKNQWVQEYIGVGKQERAALLPLAKDNHLSNCITVFFETAWRGTYGEQIEMLAKKIQEKKVAQISYPLEEGAKRDVQISDDLLKLHQNDRRQLFQEQWKRIYTSVL